MIKPMANKSPQVKAAIEDIFPGTAEAIASNRCPICKSPITKFRDSLSVKEYEISGMCQKCQDATFTPLDNDS